MNFFFFGDKSLAKNTRLRRLARGLARSVGRLKRPGAVHVVFVSDGNIRALSRRFLKKDHTTDVIAFGYDAKAGPPESPAGEIFISRDTAARAARRGGYHTLQEAALLLVHGALHLAGYDDHARRGRKRMFARQRALLNKIDPGLAPPDFQ